MIPIRDVIPSRTTPVVTVLFILINAAVFLYQQTLSEPELERFVYTYGLVPAAFHPPALITSMFLHGDWLHFLGNMLFLWIFGDNVEDRVGHRRFIVFYVLCGTAAALAQVLVNPMARIPMIGASGAVAGVMGAYLVMFPRSRVLTLVPIFFFIELVEVPALVFLGLWFLLQFVSGVGSLSVTTTQDVGGVAFWAHIAGFVAGVLWIFAFRRPERRRVEWFDV